MVAHQVTALCSQDLGSDAYPEQDRGPHVRLPQVCSPARDASHMCCQKMPSWIWAHLTPDCALRVNLEDSGMDISSLFLP